MTTAAATCTTAPGPADVPVRATMRLVVQVLPSGQVVVVQAFTWRNRGNDKSLQVRTRPTWRMVLGHVIPGRTTTWMDAERLLREAGYRTIGDWTTFARMPVVLVDEIR